MINNNRQQNGRRRGRGGQRQGGGGNQGNGSRIDNRARGNAAQLLEKYKTLAAEAQRQGDRVNTEYYLQFADHYFRVVSEQRGRFEEQDRQRREAQGQFDDQYDGGEDFDGEDGDAREAQPQQQREPRDRDSNREGRDNRDGNRADRDNDRDARGDRDNRNGRERFRRDREDRPTANLPEGAAFASEGEPAEAGEQAQPQERPRRARAPRRETVREPAPVNADTFDIDRLPPSFAPANDGAGEIAAAEPEAEAKPRRRRVRPAGEATSAG